jgi:hypothetical protein
LYQGKSNMAPKRGGGGRGRGGSRAAPVVANDDWSSPAQAASGERINAVTEDFLFTDTNGDQNKLSMVDSNVVWFAHNEHSADGWRKYTSEPLFLNLASGDLRAGPCNAELQKEDIDRLAISAGLKEAPQESRTTAIESVGVSRMTGTESESFHGGRAPANTISEGTNSMSFLGSASPANFFATQRGARASVGVLNKALLRLEQGPGKARGTRGAAFPPALLWHCVRNNNCFMRKPNRELKRHFSAEKGNLLSFHAGRFSGLAADRVIDVVPERSGNKEAVTLVQSSGSASRQRRPAQRLVKTGLTKCPKKGLAKLNAELDTYQRGLSSLAKEKYVRVHHSFRKRKRVMKSRRAKNTLA